jgi:hypothetical protein
MSTTRGHAPIKIALAHAGVVADRRPRPPSVFQTDSALPSDSTTTATDADPTINLGKNWVAGRNTELERIKSWKDQRRKGVVFVPEGGVILESDPDDASEGEEAMALRSGRRKGSAASEVWLGKGGGTGEEQPRRASETASLGRKLSGLRPLGPIEFEPARSARAASLSKRKPVPELSIPIVVDLGADSDEGEADVNSRGVASTPSSQRQLSSSATFGFPTPPTHVPLSPVSSRRSSPSSPSYPDDQHLITPAANTHARARSASPSYAGTRTQAYVAPSTPAVARPYSTYTSSSPPMNHLQTPTFGNFPSSRRDHRPVNFSSTSPTPYHQNQHLSSSTSTTQSSRAASPSPLFPPPRSSARPISMSSPPRRSPPPATITTPTQATTRDESFSHSSTDTGLTHTSTSDESRRSSESCRTPSGGSSYRAHASEPAQSSKQKTKTPVDEEVMEAFGRWGGLRATVA